jgi:hypothetical protein
MQPARLSHYLSFFSASQVRLRINEVVAAYPAIFYVIATNDEKLVRTWVEHGGDLNAIEPRHGIPALAFAILRGSLPGVDSTKVVVTMLSLGVDIAAIPKLFFMPYVDDPIDKLPLGRSYTELQEPKKKWCSEWLHPIFAGAVNLSQRYFLDKTANEKMRTDRQVQVAQAHRAMALLGVGYFLIGQTSAVRSVIQKLLTHMAMPRSKPLVMVFAGE